MTRSNFLAETFLAAALGALLGSPLLRDGLPRAALGAGVGAFGLLALRVAYLRLRKGRTLPRGYSPFTKALPVQGRETDAIRDTFKVHKVPENLDAIVIGSGISGLYLAASLARVGRRVLVLEQHYVAGGCTHVFEDKGFEFDTGLHYVGRGEKYGALLDLVSTGDEKVRLVPLGSEADGHCYDEIMVAGLAPHCYRKGRARFEADLVERFPAYACRIKKYIDLCLKVNSSADPYVFGKLFSPLTKWLVHKLAAGRFFEYAAKTLDQVLDELSIDDKALRAILCGQFGDYGLPPDRACFFTHAGVVCHYMREGAYYTAGGPETIAKALVPAIEAAGGRVLVKANVQDIVVAPASLGGRVLGVIMADGSRVMLNNAQTGIVCSTIGAQGTLKLLSKAKSLGHIPARLKWESALKGGDWAGHGNVDGGGPVKDGISHMYAFIGLKGNKSELELRSSNIWHLPADPVKLDLNDMCRRYYADPIDGLPNGEMLLFMGFPSAKDPEWEQRHPGKSTCVIITEARTKWFKDHMDGKSGKRGPEYEKLKAQWKERLLNGLYRYYPKCRGNVEYCELASPASNQYYLGRPDSYGLEPSPAKFLHRGMLNYQPQDSEVPGLYHSGQDTLTAGVFGALMSGFVTAHSILGYDWVDLLLGGRNLADDLANVKK